MNELPYWESAARLLLAIIIGGTLGFERETEDKPAGLRTHMLVALGAAAATLAALHVSVAMEDNELRLDPIRVVEGIMGGLGFLGAGSIIQSRGSVQGITTAATIWVVGAMGVCAGLGAYTIAFTVVVLAFIILRILGMMENRWLAQHQGGPKPAREEPEEEETP